MSQDQQLKDDALKRQREHNPVERRDPDERNAERKRQREDGDTSPRRTENKSRIQETKEGRDDTQSKKNTKKKKKKEKKMKKKDKKKEKKKKGKAEKN